MAMNPLNLVELLAKNTKTTKLVTKNRDTIMLMYLLDSFQHRNKSNEKNK
jgi:hypothetical protein